MNQPTQDETPVETAAAAPMPRTHKLIAVVFAMGVVSVPVYTNREVVKKLISPLVPVGSSLGNVLYDDAKHTATLPTLALFNTVSLEENLEPAHLDRPGPPKDGIPSLSDPHVVPVREAAAFSADARVIGVTVNGESRSYPVRILNYHEVVNDQLGGIPIGVFYCPLCDSFSVVDRRIDGRTLEFGVSGYVFNSNVVLYDRSEQAMWPQLMLFAASGPMAGRSLKHLAGWQVTTFGQWREQHPDSTVLSLDTGHERDYEHDPYLQIHRSDDIRFRVHTGDGRLSKKTRVIGVSLGDAARAYPIERLREQLRQQRSTDGIVTDQIAGKTIRLAFVPGSETVRVIEAPAGAKVVHTFYFAWSAFHEHTEIYGR